jgi:hypothetical protein
MNNIESQLNVQRPKRCLGIEAQKKDKTQKVKLCNYSAKSREATNPAAMPKTPPVEVREAAPPVLVGDDAVLLLLVEPLPLGVLDGCEPPVAPLPPVWVGLAEGLPMAASPMTVKGVTGSVSVATPCMLRSDPEADKTQTACPLLLEPKEQDS